MTPKELNNILVDYDPATLVEKLDITSEEIVDVFDYKIEEKFDELVAEETGEA